MFQVVAGGRTLLLKEYFHHRDDTRDRGGAEFAFLRFAWDLGIRCIPEPVAWDREARLALYEFIEGCRLEPRQVDGRAVQSAIDFFVELNSFRSSSEAKTLPNASEACFSIAEHLETVERRIQRLRSIPIGEEVDGKAAAFVEDALFVKWRAVMDEVISRTSGNELHRVIGNAERRLSPSDFGFHNALLTADGLRFLDFEYAGWDDPAKTVCDFFCQPAVPVSDAYFEDFAKAVTETRQSCRERAELLLPVFRLKWCCIMLNHFLPTDGERRKFAGSRPLIASDKWAQLTSAETLLKSLPNA